MVVKRLLPETAANQSSVSRRSKPGCPVVAWLAYLAFALLLLGLYAVVPGGDKAVVAVCIVSSLTILPLALIRLRSRDKEAKRRVGALADRLAGLHQIDLAIISAESPAQVVRGALSHLRAVVPCDRASVVLYRSEDGMADFIGVDARDGLGTPNGATLELDQFGPLEEIAAAGVVRIADIRKEHGPIFAADVAKRLSADGIDRW
jgi:hypothetical protein